MIQPEHKKNPTNTKRLVLTILIYVILIAVALIMVTPYYLMVRISFGNPDQVYDPELSLLPTDLSLDIFQKVIGSPYMNMFMYFVNSVVITSGATLIGIVITFLAAVALTRGRIPGSKFFYYLIIITVMAPWQTVIIGIFVVVNTLGLLDTYMGIILPLSANAIVFILFYNFLKVFPREIEEAAEFDGASFFQITTRIILPLSLPVVRAGFLLMFLMTWQVFMLPLLLSTTDAHYTLPVAMRFYEVNLFAQMQEILVIGTVITIPPLLIFFITQKTVLEGIYAGSVKS